MSPFQALYGRPPPSIPSYCLGSASVDSLDVTLQQRQNLLVALKANLTKARQRMSDQANKHRLEKSFNVGDWVYLKLQKYRQLSVATRLNPKLCPRYFGPYKVLRRIGHVAYELELPAEAKIHPIFHVSLLKPYFGEPPATPSPFPASVECTEHLLLPRAVLGSRLVKNKVGDGKQLLVHWEGLNESESTWVSVKDFQRLFPDFVLEGKDILPGPGDVTSGLTDNLGLNYGPPNSNAVDETSSRPKRLLRKSVWLKDYLQI